MWRIFLPLIGLAVLLMSTAAFAAYAFFGHDASYKSAQTWVQQQFGPFNHAIATEFGTSPSRYQNTSMIPLTDEATPDLHLDRNLTIKMKP